MVATIDVKDAANVTQTLNAPLPPGRTTAAASRPIVWSNEDSASIGPTGETAPSTDVGVSGLNGRLQRVAQRLSSLIALLPTSLGAGSGLKIDGSGTPLPVSGTVTVSGIPTTATDRGAGATTANTQRVSIASDQVLPPGQTTASASAPVVLASDQSNLPVVAGGSKYQSIAASTTVTLGTGATGDYIESLLCIVGTAANSLVQIKDGAGTPIDVLPNNVGAGIGSYPVPLGYKSAAGAWSVITASGVKVIASGKF
jgi:hypothetical protein